MLNYCRGSATLNSSGTYTNEATTMDFADPLTIALCIAALLVIAVACCTPAVIQVLRIRRLQRRLGRAYWPFVVGVDTRDQERRRG